MTAPAAPARPRLLLPPAHEPRAERTAASAALALLSVRSVLSPVTDGLWPVPAPVPPVAPPPLPDPTGLCGSLVLAAVEALAGTRPLAQLVRWVSPQVMEALTAAAADGTDEALGRPGRPGGSRAGSPGPGRGRQPRAGQVRGAPASGGSVAGRATVRRTHLTRVSPTAVEASVVLHDGRRVRAAALRLEVHRGHWRATVLQIG